MTVARQAYRRERRDARRHYVASLTAAARHHLQLQLAAQVLPHLGAPGVLGAYAAVGSELDVDLLIQGAMAAGWQVALPRARPAAPLRFHLFQGDPASLVPGSYHIPEPAADTAEVWPDVLLVPLLAADRHGHRLGQGGGHYDRTLAKLRASGRILAIAVAWDMQIVPDIVAESWDQRVDAIATPTRFLLTGAGAIHPLVAP